MSSLKFTELKNLVILSVVTATMIFMYGQIDFTIKPYLNWDLSVYLNMASASPLIATQVNQPFAYRVLGPYLVGLLPVPNPVGFYMLTIFSSFSLVFIYYYFLRYMGLSPTNSLVTVALFTLNKYWFGLLVWNYFQLSDLLSLIFIIILFWSMWKDYWAVFGIALLLGAITRETSMLMIPVVFTYLLEKKELSLKWKNALAATIPGLTAFFLLRILIPISSGNTLPEAFLSHVAKILSFVYLFKLLVNSFLPFSFIPFVFFESTILFFRSRKHTLLFISLVFISTLFGTDNERLMAPAFIITYTLIGMLIQEFNSEKMFFLILLTGGFVASLHHEIGRYPLPTMTLTRILSFGSLLIVTMTAIAFRVKLRKKQNNS